MLSVALPLTVTVATVLVMRWPEAGAMMLRTGLARSTTGVDKEALLLPASNSGALLATTAEASRLPMNRGVTIRVTCMEALAASRPRLRHATARGEADAAVGEA